MHTDQTDFSLLAPQNDVALCATKWASWRSAIDIRTVWSAERKIHLRCHVFLLNGPVDQQLIGIVLTICDIPDLQIDGQIS